ncbi:hypothetical protein BJV77DRAFT_995559 [Russula vinacea]|nr:hypothetical protein BJV77DRAFT_995559 [Russula vinacea]
MLIVFFVKNAARSIHTVQLVRLASRPLFQMANPTNPAFPHSHRCAFQLQTVPHRVCMNRNSRSSSISGSHSTSYGWGYHLRVTWPGRSSNHTGSRGTESSLSSSSWSTSIDGSSMIAVSLLATLANTPNYVGPTRDRKCSARHTDVQYFSV